MGGIAQSPSMFWTNTLLMTPGGPGCSGGGSGSGGGGLLPGQTPGSGDNQSAAAFFSTNAGGITPGSAS